MLLTCCGPRHLADLPPPIQVDLPSTCEELLQRIPLPKFARKDDAIAAYLAMEAVAIAQDGMIELTLECLQQQRLDYAGKGGA